MSEMCVCVCVHLCMYVTLSFEVTKLKKANLWFTRHYGPALGLFRRIGNMVLNCIKTSYFLFAVPDLKILFLAQKLNELEDFKENHRNLLNKSIDASK